MLAALFTALALAACQTTGSLTVGAPQPASGLDKLADFTLNDLANADADAVAHNDQVAHMCYPALTRFVTELQGQNAGITVAGAFGAFQRTRDLANQLNAGLPQYLVIGCAPLIVDANAMVAKLALIGGL